MASDARKRVFRLLALAVLGIAPVCVIASTAAATAAASDTAVPYSAPLREHDRQLFWGDTHLHTSASPDAYILGSRLDREAAYRFARGETITVETGARVRLRRPLDFLAITDHAEYLGVFPSIATGDLDPGDWELGNRFADYMREGRDRELVLLFSQVIQSDRAELRTPGDVRNAIWQAASESADHWNVPGQFTALIGYEWTSMVTGDNLHRVVLFRDDAERTDQIVPFSAQDSTDPEHLWQDLQRYENLTGGKVMAIAHNGNVSNGRMFSPQRENGTPLTRAYAKARARWEPVYEVTQVKGDGETHPLLSPDDPFADFETWDDGNITLTAPKTPDMLPYEYARSALREGLRHESSLGINPFRFGVIGSSDMHTGLSTTEEDNYFGKFVHDAPAKGRMQLKMGKQLQTAWRLVSAGLAAVWAEENTREGIFDALQRREVYATTGTRIRLRMFGGWDFTQADLQAHDRAVRGYRHGVPMGSELPSGSSEADAPTFMVMAYRDPLGATLDRVQMVKGWLDTEGKTHERVYDVALSARRNPQENATGDVGNTVDLSVPGWKNSIGSDSLETVWTDPDFNPSQPAFYYLRVLEIPTPRWTAYDAVIFSEELDPQDSGVIQERAYSSPIWYHPG